MRSLHLLFALLLLLGPYSTSAQQPLSSLDTAYERNSTEELEQFLESWRKSVPTFEDGDQTPAFRAALEIFKEFYRPRQLERLGNPEWGTALYASARYAIIQETLRYQVVAAESFPGKLVSEGDRNGSIEVSFCPRMELGDMKTICLTDSLAGLLQQFLGDEANVPFPALPVVPIRSAEEIEKRLDFVNRRLKVFRGHWGGWYFETHPRVSLIRFNRHLNEAIVHFQVVHEGGEARYKRTEQGWVFQEARFTWIM